MIVYEDMCVGCPPDVCGRGYCPYSEPIPIHVCDRCENNSDDCLYIYIYITMKNSVMIVLMTK